MSEEVMARRRADRALVSDEARSGLHPSGFDPSRDDPRKGYLLGKLDERKDITRFLAVRSARALINYHNLPWWAFVRRFQCRWTAFSCSLAASDIEAGDHATDQAIWLVNIDNGVIVGRDAFRRDSDEHRNGEDGDSRLSGEAMPARADEGGIAQPDSAA